MWFVICSFSFSGLSLVLNKEGLWLTKMDTQAERTLSRATHRRQELIHTSCRSESSNISLVVLDNDDGFGHHLQCQHPRPALGENGLEFVLLGGEPGGKVESWTKAYLSHHVFCTFAHSERLAGLAQKEFLLSSSTCASAAIYWMCGEPGQPAFHTAAQLARARQWPIPRLMSSAFDWHEVVASISQQTYIQPDRRWVGGVPEIKDKRKPSQWDGSKRNRWSLNKCPSHTEIFSKRRKIYSWMYERLELYREDHLPW